MQKGFVVGKSLRKEDGTSQGTKRNVFGDLVETRDLESEAKDITNEIQAAGGIVTSEGNQKLKKVVQSSDFTRYPTALRGEVEHRATQTLLHELNNPKD